MSGNGSRDRYRVRRASSTDDLRRAQALRFRAFGVGGDDGLDRDAFDDRCSHFLIESMPEGALVATFRVLRLRSGAEVPGCYSAQYYDLSGLESFPAPMAELGRFCVAPGQSDPEILRRAWGALTGFVDHEGIALLFGCTSFAGTDQSAYADAFDLLRRCHVAPARYRPGRKASDIVPFLSSRSAAPDRKRALRTMPSLLRSYLAMGGWVSDHAVVDRHMNTLHVFTGLEIEHIPAARARVLRAVAV